MANRAHAPHAVIEDACQTAWARLCARQDVEVEAPHTVRWLVVVAVHEAWRKSGGREVTVGGWLPEVDGPGELREPCGDAPDQVAVAVSRDVEPGSSPAAGFDDGAPAALLATRAPAP